MILKVFSQVHHWCNYNYNLICYLLLYFTLLYFTLLYSTILSFPLFLCTVLQHGHYWTNTHRPKRRLRTRIRSLKWFFGLFRDHSCLLWGTYEFEQSGEFKILGEVNPMLILLLFSISRIFDWTGSDKWIFWIIYLSTFDKEVGRLISI